jgi:hypothetical protein
MATFSFKRFKDVAMVCLLCKDDPWRDARTALLTMDAVRIDGTPAGNVKYRCGHTGEWAFEPWPDPPPEESLDRPG